MYSCNLTAFLTVARQPPTIDSFEGLLKSGLKLVGLGPYYGNLMKESENEVMKVSKCVCVWCSCSSSSSSSSSSNRNSNVNSQITPKKIPDPPINISQSQS